MTADNRSALIVESYKAIRSELIAVLGERAGCRSFTVTSPSSGDGKTTTAINIAIAFSQLGKRVLLIDAELRGGNVHKKLRTSSPYGLSELLQGECVLDKAISSVGASFDILTSGEPVSRPELLLSSEEFDNLITGLKFAYDFIIIDTPSVCERNDLFHIALKTDGAILVVRDTVTPHSKINKAINLLADAGVPLLGTVLNASKTNDNK